MYAAVKKIKISPVHLLVAHWLVVPTYQVGPVAICSLVTRIASNLNMLQGASLNFIEEHHDTFGYDHLVHAHLLKRVNDELYMMYVKGSRCPRGGVNWAFLKINCKN
jgi:hypothetical protein